MLCGSLAGVAAVTLVARRASSRRKARVAAQVASNTPSLLQLLEQKKLLSTAKDLGLLSKAEAAGVGIQTPEELGLLKLAEDLKLLSLAESVVTNRSTPLNLLAGGALLGVATYLDVTAEDFGFAQWVLAGALGAPALVLEVAGLVLFGLTSGTKRTKPLERDDVIVSYALGSGFTTTPIKESVSLIDGLESRKILSFVEENRLLTLASGFVKKPLTLTEGLLPAVESAGVLTTLESLAATNGLAKVGASGFGLLLVALLLLLFVPDFGGLLAVLPALAGVVLVGTAIVLTSLLTVPPRFQR